jgi:hypothetical protein
MENSNPIGTATLVLTVDTTLFDQALKHAERRLKAFENRVNRLERRIERNMVLEAIRDLPNPQKESHAS